MSELNLRFPDPQHVIVRWGELETEKLDFKPPLDVKERQDLTWYLETYSAHYTTSEDDAEAARIAALLPLWGQKLFQAAFADPVALTHFNDFLRTEEDGRLLTISAQHPAVLGLPWELLHTVGAGSSFLLDERPRISVRRRVAGSTGIRSSYKPQVKEALRLLFVISRPSGASFIDPRADAMAVLDAIEQHAPGRVTVEFLRPATFENLVARLNDPDRPKVDILHFDGHGVFDGSGALRENARSGAARLSNELLREGATGDGTNTGYLLFEDKDGKNDLVPANALGQQLHQSKIGLVVLSACQTAMVGGDDDAMGSVAARLTATGIPSVLAMSHSVLVPTTERLFGKFYEQLARGRGVGEALEEARNYLRLDPKRREVQRGARRQQLELQDWCVPTLYQPGTDGPLLQKGVAAEADRKTEGVIFCGRRRELWQIERWFVGGARRISLSGFGGQGKTHLAQEVGRWLTRTGMFERVLFVSFASFQGVDALGAAVSSIGVQLGVSLIDKDAVTAELRNAKTLLILDNLEDVPSEQMGALLSAAKEWSEVPGCRVLVTARPADLGHEAFALEGVKAHQHLPLRGLDPDSALKLYNEVLQLTPLPTVPKAPARDDLIALFARVEHHPLSIRLLSEQLKTRLSAEVLARLDEILLEDTSTDKDKSLRASLKLSLDKMPSAIREKWLPRLGVFQGGAMEKQLVNVTKIPNDVWSFMRPELLRTTLIEMENLHVFGIEENFLKFHPTLAPSMWSQLTDEQQNDLQSLHRECYFEITKFLYEKDSNLPQQTRIIFLRERDNILKAVNQSLAQKDHYAVDFANYAIWFLNQFGWKKEVENLLDGLAFLSPDINSWDWYFTQFRIGENLHLEGRSAEAIEVFRKIHERLANVHNYQRCAVLSQLGACAFALNQVEQAQNYLQDALSISTQINPTPELEKLQGILHKDLADIDSVQGRFNAAQDSYITALSIFQRTDFLEGQALIIGQLGGLAIRMGDLDKAEQNYQKALTLFQVIGRRNGEAGAWHHLGIIQRQKMKWVEAEHSYREAARISEAIGDYKHAAITWCELASLCADMDRPDFAEQWYWKAHNVFTSESTRNDLGVAKVLHDIAWIAFDKPNGLGESEKFAKQSLQLRQQYHPSVAVIWESYRLLAEISIKKAQSAEAKLYRQQARISYWNHSGTRLVLIQSQFLLRDFLESIRSNVDEKANKWLNYLQQQKADALILALRKVEAGERDEDVLCEKLNWHSTALIMAILRGIENPAWLNKWLAGEIKGGETDI